MRRYIILLFLAIPLMARLQNIVPDHTWHDNNNRFWNNDDYGTCFINYNGLLYLFNFQDNGIRNGAYPYIYTMNKNHNYAALEDYKIGPDRKNKINNFGYVGENSSYDRPHVMGRNCAFQFNDRLWYFQHVNACYASDHEQPANESYECFAQLPVDTMLNCFSYYDLNSPPPDIYKMGAFQLDSNLYFIGLNTKSGSSNYHKWAIQEYSFDKTTNKFSHVKDQYISQIMYTNLGGHFKRLDSFGNEYIVLNTYDQGGYSLVSKLTPTVGPQGTQFTYSVFIAGGAGNVGASTIVEGSIKGNKSTDKYPDYPDRITWFTIDYNASTDGIHHMHYGEFAIVGDNDMIWANGGEITIPSSVTPSKVGDTYQILGSYELEPKKFSMPLDSVNGKAVDGYQQYVWLFFPDWKDNINHFNGFQFISDQWRMTNEEIVTSVDLTNKEKYPGIEGLWSLVGICDGGPPVSVNWPVWKDPLNHIPGVEPTELNFTFQEGLETEVTSSYEDAWSVGESMKMSVPELPFGLSEEFKYSSAYKHTISNGKVFEKKLSQPFVLTEETQELGVYIWAVPSLIRYPFSTYPWWDKGWSYPIPNSKQYLFRADGVSLITESVPIEEFPFNITEPNSTDLASWRIDARTELKNAILYNGVSPIISASWTSPQKGQKKSYAIAASSSESYEHSTEYEIKAEAGVEIPEVFSLQVSGSYSVKYSTENKLTTKFGTEIEANLENLVSNTLGPNIKFLDLRVYWFRNQTNSNWWYYSEFGDQKPWYIAYLVNDCFAKIKLLSPENGTQFENAGMLFTWMAEEGIIKDYTLIISDDSPIYNNNIVFSQSTGNRNDFTLSGFKPEKGKNYYWAIKGITDDDKIVWSDINSFTYIDSKLPSASTSLQAVIYPNPASSSDITLYISSTTEVPVEIRIIDINGIIRAEKEIIITGGLSMNAIFPGLNLSAGIYFAAIRSGSEQIVRKIMIN